MVRKRRWLLRLLICSTLGVGGLLPVVRVRADPVGVWWDDAWPYRIPVDVEGSGVVEVAIDFTEAFETLGLSGALLDVRSLRVVPYDGATSGFPVPYGETYTTMLEDADTPQIGWHSSGVYWSINNDEGYAEADANRFTQGEGSLKVTIENQSGGYGYPGAVMWIAEGDARSDWRAYETLIYDVWPEVNESALDQTPDLYWYKLYSACNGSAITQGGPPLAMDRWNRVSVSLDPLHTCSNPTLGDIPRMEFHTRDNATVHGNSGLWDDGDRLTLWLDNLRLVDQDSGVLRWQIDESVSRYYVYFDVLRHEGHPQADLDDPGVATVVGAAGAPEAGGYFHRIDGAVTGDLAVWAAPPVTKIGRGEIPPIDSALLRIHAGRDEFEPFQLVVRSPTAQSLVVDSSDFTGGSGMISSDALTLHRVDDVSLTQRSDHFGRVGDWPDALYPVTMGNHMGFPSGENQRLWFTVHVPRDALAGVYTATVTVGTATIPVSLEVWDFTMPREIHLAGEWGFGWSQVVEMYGGTHSGSVQDCYWDLVDALYEDFADHRLTPKGVGWPAGLNYPGGVAYDCDGNLDPDAWGDWDFHTLAQKYLRGEALDNSTGFPSFLIRGPSSNWPPASRPSSFCSESRGTDPPGNSGYNAKWFQYWGAVDGYLGEYPDYAAKGTYHIVNEPQTFADYDIVAYLASETKANAPDIRILVSEQVEPSIYDNPTYPGAKIDVWMPTITNYQVSRAHDRQQNHGEEVWWYFLYGDRPPLPNPTVIDRPGIEARITPWLAWLERVRGLVYYSTTDWNPNPWVDAWINDGNGDGFLFYPPNDGSIAYDPCVPESNRLVTSIRWELLREGMEDYEYLWLLNGGAGPEVGVANEADGLVAEFVESRTLFSRVPTDVYATRAAIAEHLTAPEPPTADKDVSPAVVGVGEMLTYTLVYHAGEIGHTLIVSDTVPVSTTVLTVKGSRTPNPTQAGQNVTWELPVGVGEVVTLTITSEAAMVGRVVNTASFSGTRQLEARAQGLVYRSQVLLPVILRRFEDF